VTVPEMAVTFASRAEGSVGVPSRHTIHIWRSAIAPGLSSPTTCKEFLPISTPITAIVMRACSAMNVLLVFGAPGQLQTPAGQEHDRTIPLGDMPARVNDAPSPLDRDLCGRNNQGTW